MSSTYRPPAGTVCQISGPHCDDDSGYLYDDFTILWQDDTFVLYGKPQCYPNLQKWDHVICRPLAGQPLVHPMIDFLAAVIQARVNTTAVARLTSELQPLGDLDLWETINSESEFVLNYRVRIPISALKINDPKGVTWDDQV